MAFVKALGVACLAMVVSVQIAPNIPVLAAIASGLTVAGVAIYQERQEAKKHK